ncbi:MAG: PKD domain-containing protein [Bacteroidales bacterium]|nr:PKD domain-containing protein [Bacteroidales bacterium]
MKKKTSILKFSVFLLLAMFIHGCSESYDPGNDPLPWEQAPGISIAAEKVQQVMDIQDRATKALFRNPEVVGTGTGIDDNGNPAIVVYTMTKVEQRADINLENVGLGERPTALPVSIDRIPVVPKVTGMFKAYSDPTAWFPRPVPIGVSTGHPDITAGTIGCRVKDSQGNVYALSNNHVYANVNEASIGDNVLQPGSYDGGVNPGDAIGTLYDFEPIDFSTDNTMDAAIALVSTSTLGTATPTGDGYGTPSTTLANADIGLDVQKYGRTTGYTHGVVSEINVTVDVCYETRGPYNCVKSARFVNQFTITPGDFSAGGDSGSLIVSEEGNNPVGLLFAGGSTHTIATPIGVVLSRFGVSIDNESGGTVNYPPAADFTYTIDNLNVSFTDQSTDSDGSITAWSWTFGDGGTSTAQNPSHTYGAGGTYTVGLTVKDDGGATGSTSKNVSVSSSSGGDGIILTASGYKVRGVRFVDLEWTGASGAVDIYRNNVIVAENVSESTYTDNLGRVSGTFTYKVCESGSTSVCSNEETVVF